MGGMAIMLAFSNAKIFKTIAEDGKPTSYFMKIIGNFFHFIVAQTIGIILALSSIAYSNNYLSFFGFWSLVYAMLVGVATAGQLLMTAQIFNATASIMDEDDDN
jgi:ABC-type siderophore export system fused ATPase/permease subunit